MGDPREDRRDGEAKAAEVHEDHEASVNQVGDQPFPASHDDERGQPAAGKDGAGPAPAPAAPARHDDDAADGDDSADFSRD
jgi:hypothetical protein